jgi:hypothetical protein
MNTGRRSSYVWMLALACLAGLALIPSAASASGEFEPNDSLLTSAGPMTGGVPINATLETDNDQDWYRFYTITRTQLDITMTGFSDAFSGCAELDLYNADGDNITGDNEVDGRLNQIQHLTETVPTGLYYVRIVQDVYDSCVGSPDNRYAWAVVPAAYITPKEGCGQAYVAQRDAQISINSTTRRLSKHHPRRKKKKLKKSLKQAQLALSQAQAAIASSC